MKGKARKILELRHRITVCFSISSWYTYFSAMEHKPPKETIEHFDALIRNLSSVITNSVLYSAKHSVFATSMKNLKASIDDWFLHGKKLEIGISPSNISLNGSYLKEDNDLYTEVAEYLHRRGVLALTIHKAITVSELIHLFLILKEDPRRLSEKGGLLKNLPQTSHLKIQELDYSPFLGSAKEKITPEEEDLWQSLCKVNKESEGGTLPTSRQEFLRDFLRNSKNSAGLLNKIYRQAVSKVEEDTVLTDMRMSMSLIIKYFEKKDTENSLSACKDLAETIGNLDLDLVLKLFEGTEINGESLDLAHTITKNFSDNMLGEFIGSLLGREGGGAENLFKLFNKFMPDKKRIKNIASLATDKLLQNTKDPHVLKQLQASIKELVEKRPGNEFMSEMYKITVGTFVSEPASNIRLGGKLTELVGELKEDLSENKICSDTIRLILNIIWLEGDPLEIENLTERLIGYFPKILEISDVGSIKNMIELYTQKLSDKRIAPPIKKCKDRITCLISDDKTIDKLISFIPEAKEKALNDITSISSHVKHKYKNRLIDAYVREEDPAKRRKFLHILSKMGKDISKEISQRIEGASVSVIKRLFNVLQSIDPENARIIAKQLLCHKDPRIRLEALQGYFPENHEERTLILKKFAGDKDKAIRKKALEQLVKTKNRETIEKLFNSIQKVSRNRKYLLAFVRLCGDNKIAVSIPYLERILFRKTLFNTSYTDRVRTACVVALRQIHTPRAMELITKGLAIKRKAVKRMCEITLNLEKHNGADEE